MSQIEKDYQDKDPTSIIEGDEIESDFSVCGVCFERITQPVLKNIWYHGNHSEDDHVIVVANIFIQLYEMLQDQSSRIKDQCKCFTEWNNLINITVNSGFYGNCYFNSDCVSICGKYIMRLVERVDNNPQFPDNQDYNCVKCLNKLKRQKIIKIIPHIGKSNNPIFNKITWIKNESTKK